MHIHRIWRRTYSAYDNAHTAHTIMRIRQCTYSTYNYSMHIQRMQHLQHTFQQYDTWIGYETEHFYKTLTSISFRMNTITLNAYYVQSTAALKTFGLTAHGSILRNSDFVVHGNRWKKLNYRTRQPLRNWEFKPFVSFFFARKIRKRLFYTEISVGHTLPHIRTRIRIRNWPWPRIRLVVAYCVCNSGTGPPTTKKTINSSKVEAFAHVRQIDQIDHDLLISSRS